MRRIRVLLIQVDEKLPNLALMKLSAWHKSQGDEVGFHVRDPDKVYASVIFRKHKAQAEGIKTFYPDAEVLYGGPGYSLDAKLPDEIEYLKPDYSLYPENDYSMGFTTRGCIRHCPFCIVPQKEGKLVRWQHPKDFHNPAFHKIMLLDNNWLADKDWFMETSQWIKDNGLALREGGMDIRLMTDEIAQRLAELKWYKPMKFAFDADRDEQAVLDGIKMLKAAEVDVRRNVWFYVYLNDDLDQSFDSALARCHLLKENGTGAFVMFNIDERRSARVRQLQRWANKPWLYWSIDYSEYDRKKAMA